LVSGCFQTGRAAPPARLFSWVRAGSALTRNSASVLGSAAARTRSLPSMASGAAHSYVGYERVSVSPRKVSSGGSRRSTTPGQGYRPAPPTAPGRAPDHSAAVVDRWQVRKECAPRVFHPWSSHGPNLCRARDPGIQFGVRSSRDGSPLADETARSFRTCRTGGGTRRGVCPAGSGGPEGMGPARLATTNAPPKAE
jgi:hypothetical protein